MLRARADEHLIGHLRRPRAAGTGESVDGGLTYLLTRTVQVDIAEELKERPQAIGQSDTERQRVHDKRVTIRLIGEGLPAAPTL